MELDNDETFKVQLHYLVLNVYFTIELNSN